MPPNCALRNGQTGKLSFTIRNVEELQMIPLIQTGARRGRQKGAHRDLEGGRALQ